VTVPEARDATAAWAEDLARDLGPAPGAYVHFLADEGPERVRAAYPGATWDRLAAVKRRVDPDNLFHGTQNVPPAPGA
jgi:FAD/FMN-containing dehydrogenase